MPPSSLSGLTPPPAPGRPSSAPSASLRRNLRSSSLGAPSPLLSHITLAEHIDSYQVLKEVGKVGAQSPAFIEPVAARKDGINALFARQAAVAAARSPSQKRPRSVSMEPDTPLPDATDAGPPEETAPPTKKAATEEWEDDSEIEFIGQVCPLPFHYCARCSRPDPNCDSPLHPGQPTAAHTLRRSAA